MNDSSFFAWCCVFVIGFGTGTLVTTILVELLLT